MNPKDILHDIERQSVKKQVSMAQLCRMAGIEYSTYWRWTKGHGMTINKLSALQNALDRIPTR